MIGLCIKKREWYLIYFNYIFLITYFLPNLNIFTIFNVLSFITPPPKTLQHLSLPLQQQQQQQTALIVGLFMTGIFQAFAEKKNLSKQQYFGSFLAMAGMYMHLMHESIRNEIVWASVYILGAVIYVVKPMFYKEQQ